MAALPFRHPDADAPAVSDADGAAAAPEASDLVTTSELPAPAPGLDQATAATPAPVVGAVPSPELTPRALLLGCAIGVVLAAGNVYTGLKLGFIDSGALTATMVSFATFAALRRFGPRAFTPLENNVAQTVAASAAVMGLVHGLSGPMPALALMKTAMPPAWALWAWGLGLGLLGVLAGLWSRRKLIVEDALPFPSGGATAQLIRVLHTDGNASVRPMRLMAAAAVVAGAVAWCRDGHGAWLPQAVYLPLTIAGLAASGLTVGIAVSPLMAATGIFIGLRGSITFAATGVIGWVVLAPVLVGTHLVGDAAYGSVVAWLVWPAFGLMLGGSVGPLLVGARQNVKILGRTLGDTVNLAARLWRVTRQGARPEGTNAGARRDRLAVGLVLVGATALLGYTGHRAFGFSLATVALAIVVALALAGVCARAAGETDIAPVGNMGTFAQLLFGRSGPAGSILAGSVAAGTAAQTSQTLWGLKAGQVLRASVRSQTLAQLVGVLLGSVVVVPTYLAIVRTTPLGTELMPAVSAVSWRATAEAVAGGLSKLPPHGLHAAVFMFALGIVFSVAARARAGRFLPSPVVMGIALITPLSMSAAVFAGAAGVALVRRRFSSFSDADAHALGAGALAGESLVAVILAVLASF